MDAWRRKLDRMNARAVRTSARHASAEVKNWPKFLVAMGVVIIAILFANRECVIYLRDLPSASAGPLITPDASNPAEPANTDGALAALRVQAEQGDGRAQCRAGKMLAQEVGAAARIEAVKWLDLCVRDPTHEGDDEARELYDKLIESASWDIVGEGRYQAFQWQQANINRRNGEPGSASKAVLKDLPQMGGQIRRRGHHVGHHGGTGSWGAAQRRTGAGTFRPRRRSGRPGGGPDLGCRRRGQSPSLNRKAPDGL